jgi:nitric oxide reductase NorD protein
MQRRVHLSAIRRRLELLLKAHYGRSFEIVEDRTLPTKWWERLFADVRHPSRSPEPVAVISGDAIVLPREIAVSPEAPSPEERYRLLAAAAAEREVRGTLAAHASLETRLERELFWVKEGAAIDAAIADQFPTLKPALELARKRILAKRPNQKAFSPLELAVEREILSTLTSPVSASSAWSASSALAVQSRDEARRLTQEHPGTFTGTAPVGHWGTCPQTPIAKPPSNPTTEFFADGRGEIEIEQETEDQSRFTDDQRGQQEDDDPDRASLESAPDLDLRRARMRRIGTPFKYPEWNHRKHVHVPDATTVWSSTAPSALIVDAGSSATTRQLREQFQRLRAHRESRKRQYTGDALDLPAVVDGLIDRRMGRTPDERVYEETRVNRQSLAIALLVDISGSTGNPLADGQRIIDLERVALRMAHDGLEAVGDPYAMFAFSSIGAHDVQVLTLKGFAERGSVAPARIAALQPDQNTRLGAAIRHVSRVLGEQPAAHQLLLVVTDGRPSDVAYDEEFGVADTRRAILDARNRGTTVFGLAIDPEDHSYLTELFGPSGYVWVRDPHALGRQLLRSISMMLRS